MSSEETRLNFPIDECPYCGSKFFMRKVKVLGYGYEIYESNGCFSEDNSALYDHLSYKQNRRFYCGECEKYLFKLD
ncbi:hypothetical protein [Lactococcus petauri]|uniref:hypothetical protein n=1 Tax=Lactococcus petauri TaxID=1940789 RepID=UPI001F580B4D|nr:hypothetical protein [Lactococcus petauri]